MLIVGLLRRWYDHAPWPDALRWGLGLGFAMSFSEPVKESLRRRGMGYLAAACIGGLVAVALAVGLWVAITVVLQG